MAKTPREEEFAELCADAETLRDRVPDSNSDVCGIVTAAMGLAIRMAYAIEATLEGEQKDQWQAIHASEDLLRAEVALLRNEVEDRGENWRNVVITCQVCKQKFGVGVCDRSPIYVGITCPWCGTSTREIEPVGTTSAVALMKRRAK